MYVYVYAFAYTQRKQQNMQKQLPLEGNRVVGIGVVVKLLIIYSFLGRIDLDPCKYLTGF